MLGYPNLGDLEVGINVYVGAPDAPELYCHPKVETWVAGKNGEDLKWSPNDWDAINAALREIAISHLHHAGVSTKDLEPDDEVDLHARKEFRGKRPASRRKWLRNYYADLKSSVEHEPVALGWTSRDILRAIIYEGRDLTLSELAERTGATKRAITRRVKDMEHVGEPDEPGIVDRVHSSECHVTMSREMRKQVRKLINSTHPDETWSEVVECAEQRRRRRERPTSTLGDSAGDDFEESSEAVDDDQGDDTEPFQEENSGSSTTWKYLAETDLKADDLAIAVRREFLGERDIRVKVDTSPPWFTS